MLNPPHVKACINQGWEFASCTQRWLKVRPANLTLQLPIRHDYAYALLELTLRDNSTRRLQITLRREIQGVLKDCWLLDHLGVYSRHIKSPYPDNPFNDTS